MLFTCLNCTNPNVIFWFHLHFLVDSKQNISIDQEIVVNPPVAVQQSFDGGVTYSVIEGNEADLFYLEPVNGTLYLRRQVDREKLDTDVFSLVIEASAAADSTRFSLARLMVQVLDVNDNAPRFDPPYHNVSIVENLPNGFNVLKSIAIDPDQVGFPQDLIQS